MERPRPLTVSVLGIANVVLGTFGILCNCLVAGLILLLENPGEFGKNPDVQEFRKNKEQLRQEIPSYQVIEIGEVSTNWVLSVLWLASGIGLLYMQPWGRRCALIFAVIKSTVEVSLLAFYILLVRPAAERLQVPGAAGDPADILNEFLNVFPSVFSIVYSILLIVLLLQPGITAAFSRDEMGFYDDFDSAR